MYGKMFCARRRRKSILRVGRVTPLKFLALLGRAVFNQSPV